MSANIKIYDNGQVVWDLSHSAGRIIAVIDDESTSGTLDYTLEQLGGGTVFCIAPRHRQGNLSYQVSVSNDGHISYTKHQSDMLAIGVYS